MGIDLPLELNDQRHPEWLQHISEDYFNQLDEFSRLSIELVKKGYAYWSVIMCHELYRFLYPSDTYADFTQQNPVGFIHDLIRSLIESGRNVMSTVKSYENQISVFGTDPMIMMELGHATSELYSDLWKSFDARTLQDESLQLVKHRLPRELIKTEIAGKEVLDMGCGSGRYSIALARSGARKVVGIDWQLRAFEDAQRLCQQQNLPVEFREGDVLKMPFEDESFDFVFCNGVLHHTESIERGIQEILRVLRPSHKAFLYLYASGGIFWKTRVALRQIFRNIPLAYTKLVLKMIGMPSNRFIFCDTWYVPVETHTTKDELEVIMHQIGFQFEKIIGKNPFDLDGAIERGIFGASEMWGDGEHRYILEKSS